LHRRAAIAYWLHILTGAHDGEQGAEAIDARGQEAKEEKGRETRRQQSAGRKAVNAGAVRRQRAGRAAPQQTPR
jgi:hypothetical protein